MFCQKHTHLEVTSFCRTDLTALCPECVVDSHLGHSIDRLAVVAQEHKDAIAQLVAKVRAQNEGTGKVMATLDRSIESLESQAREAERDIHLLFEKIRAVVAEREALLLSNLEAARHEWDKRLKDGKQQLEFISVGIREGSLFADVLVKEGTGLEVIASQASVVSRLSSLQAGSERAQENPVPDVRISLRTADQLVTPQIEGGIQGLGHIECWNFAPKRRARLYRRDYAALRNQSVHNFGSTGRGDGQFLCPYAVACNSRDDIIVSDNQNHRVQVFDRSGKFLLKFGSKGDQPGWFNCPWGVCVDERNDNIIVADTNNHRVQVFDERGTIVRAFGIKGSRDGQLDGPRGVTADPEGNIYVVDEFRVHIFTSAGLFVRRFGQLTNPYGLGLLSHGEVVVCDKGNPSLRVFDAGGTLVRAVGVTNLKNPFFVFVDSDDNILVANQDPGSILVTRPDGTLRDTLRLGSMAAAAGICMDGQGRIITTDTHNGRIWIY